MKKQRFTLFAAAVALAILLSGTACERRPLFLADNQARLELTVHDTLPLVGKVPSGNLYETRLYDHSTGKLSETSYTGPSGGDIYAPAGSYDLICSTFDTESILFSEEGGLQTLMASTNPAPVSVGDLYRTVVRAAEWETAEAVDRMPVVRQPDYLFSATVQELAVPFRDVEDERFVIKADAWPVVRTCRLVARGVTGQSWLADATVFLSGVAPGCRLVGRTLLEEASALWFSLGKSPEDRCLKASFNTFGFLPGLSNQLYLLLTDTEGGRYLFHFDVTKQCPRGGEAATIYVDLDFDIPEPVHGGGGFAPTVDEWNVVTHPVEL